MLILCVVGKNGVDVLISFAGCRGTHGEVDRDCI